MLGYFARWKQQLIDQAGGKCPCCQRSFLRGVVVPTFDHVMPLSKGGATKPGNIDILCKKCNMMKNDMLPEEWEAFKQTWQSKRGKKDT